MGLSSFAGSSGIAARQQNRWYPFGFVESEPIGVFGTWGPGAIMAGVSATFGVAGGMFALPGYFPEKGKITKIAVIVGGPAGEAGWIGLARNSIVNGDNYPGKTIASVATVCTVNNQLLGATVNVAVNAELMWFIFQSKRDSGTGNWWGRVLADTPMYGGGFADLAGLNLGDSAGGAALTYHTSLGYQTPPASVPGYIVGRDFPASMPIWLTNDNAHNVFDVSYPECLYQWTRG